jgi:hypothetical protein
VDPEADPEVDPGNAYGDQLGIHSAALVAVVVLAEVTEVVVLAEVVETVVLAEVVDRNAGMGNDVPSPSASAAWCSVG